MQAVLVREHGVPETLRVEEVNDPEPAADEVVVDVHAAGVNYPDILVIQGEYQILPPRPFSPGKDAAGVVSAVGSKVTGYRPGDRVAVQVEYGAYAEKIVVQEDKCFHIPHAMTFADAAAMGLAYQTAYFALVERGQFKEGESVLVNGAAGGVGLAAVQIARALGATVFAGVANDAQGALARRNGAHHVVRLDLPDVRESLRNQVYDMNGGKGVAIVLDPLGGDVFDASLRALDWCGRIVVIGFAAGRIPQIKANYLLVKNITACGLQWSDYRDRTPDKIHRVQKELCDLYIQGKIKPSIMQQFSMHDFASALQLQKSGKVEGKLVLLTGAGRACA
ncbi:NADPH:quinone oxidoreductase family protein [Noviherbaspirillum denitrificans]|uniref:NADPH:quinone oxidoreductase n=1 Tax=Noviherbaspirillum denitrificans TaxID=1968433 RepID=A0A254T7K3_9BURK|nr:NADPH:quinone oxidoreductase family protein [Noviherbaspirillum denitrificans]OWW18157.1 NADPH:quinone oxidoreductase [Noviherbaspirillum denitrificans]